jgi:hypothetical protein
MNLKLANPYLKPEGFHGPDFKSRGSIGDGGKFGFDAPDFDTPNFKSPQSILPEIVPR